MMKPMEITGSGRARRRERTKREWRKEWGFRTRSLRVVRLQDAPHTSNRRHILAREMIENERGPAINPDDAVQEKISLSDRFGLWIGFHSCSQDDYLAMVFGYVEHFGLVGSREKIEREALEWAITRGSRSGRTAPRRAIGQAGRMTWSVQFT